MHRYIYNCPLRPANCRLLRVSLSCVYLSTDRFMVSPVHLLALPAARTLCLAPRADLLRARRQPVQAQATARVLLILAIPSALLREQPHVPYMDTWSSRMGCVFWMTSVHIRSRCDTIKALLARRAWRARRTAPTPSCASGLSRRDVHALALSALSAPAPRGRTARVQRPATRGSAPRAQQCDPRRRAAAPSQSA